MWRAPADVTAELTLACVGQHAAQIERKRSAPVTGGLKDVACFIMPPLLQTSFLTRRPGVYFLPSAHAYLFIYLFSVKGVEIEGPARPGVKNLV